MEKNIKGAGKAKEMLIGKIYGKVFVPMSEKSGNADGTMNDRLLLLVTGADMANMNQAQLTELVCKGAVIGQREGFIAGVRFTAKLFCNMLS